jgi:phosphate/sulfate permease
MRSLIEFLFLSVVVAVAGIGLIMALMIMFGWSGFVLGSLFCIPVVLCSVIIHACFFHDQHKHRNDWADFKRENW